MTKTKSNKTNVVEPDFYGHRQRLKERFILGGGRDMPDYEMLELLLTLSIPRRDVKSIAKQLLAKFDSFAGVINAPAGALYEIPYIKENTYVVFSIVREAAIRSSWDNLQNKDTEVINNWDAMIDYCRTAMGYRDVEEFRIIFLDVKLKVMGEEIQQRGTINQVSIHPREVIKAAMFRGARAIILVHNHPSGDVTPSHADLDITNKINVAGAAVGIRLFDHLIVSKGGYYSFLEHALITDPNCK